MTSCASRHGRRSRSVPRIPTRVPVLALALAVVHGVGLAAAPAGAAEEVTTTAPTSEERVLDREAIIGRLIPITGDPLEIRSLDLRVEFRIDSARLTEGAAAQLRELGAALTSEALGGAAIGVYGHTDTSGPAQYNQALSERRAQAVAEFLREHFAIEGERFREVRGYGEERLREDLAPDAPSQRRVEIVSFHEAATGGSDSMADVPSSGGSERSGEEVAQQPVGGDDSDDAVVRVGRGDGTTTNGRDEDTTEGGGTGGYVVIQ